MKIKIIKCLQDNYSYVIIDENNQSACVVDPSESKPIIDFIDKNKIDLKYILNTSRSAVKSVLRTGSGSSKELKLIHLHLLTLRLQAAVALRPGQPRRRGEP